MDAGSAAVAMICLGALARSSGFVAVATWPVFPGVCLRVRAGLAVVLAAAVMPAVLARATGGAGQGGTLMAVPGEFLVGSVMGTAVACVTASAAWAAGMLAAASGIPAGDSVDPESAEAGGVARLAWWIAAGGFLAAGGNRLVVGGLLDSFQSLPVGRVAEGAGAFADVVWQLPAAAFAIAVSLALPALLALVAFHATAAIVIRGSGWTPGQGMLQSLAGLLLLGVLYASVGSWTTSFPAVIEPAVQRCFSPASGGGE